MESCPKSKIWVAIRVNVRIIFFINYFLKLAGNEQVAALSAAIESTFQSAVIMIQIYNKDSVNHKTAALKQTRVSKR
jgi:hypothetical protein